MYSLPEVHPSSLIRFSNQKPTEEAKTLAQAKKGGFSMYIHLSNVDGPRMPPPPAVPDGIGGMVALQIER